MNTAQVDGNTRLYVIVGDPIRAVRSPEVFNTLLSEQNRNAVLIPLHVSAADFTRDWWRDMTAIRNLDGLVITMPHKPAAASFVDHVGATGGLIGAINAARRDADGKWSGDMFDGLGFVDGLRAQGHAPEGRRVRLHGLGGAGAAMAVALARTGVARLELIDVAPGRAATLAKAIAARVPDVELLTQPASTDDVDWAINATPLGMRADDVLPFDPIAFPIHTLIVDIVTKPEMTPLLTRAQAAGQRIHTGRHMHGGQARRVARFFGLAA